MHALISGAYRRAEEILNEHRDQLDALASLLIEREKLDEVEFECFMTGRELPAPKPAEAPAAKPAEDTPQESAERESAQRASDSREGDASAETRREDGAPSDGDTN